MCLPYCFGGNAELTPNNSESLRQIILKTNSISAGSASEDPNFPDSGLVEAQQRLRRMVLDTVASPNSRRNYGKALDNLFALAGGRPLTPALFMEYRASMEALSPSTANVRLSAGRELGAEGRRDGINWGRRRREARGSPEHPPEGNSPGELAHPGAGEGAAGRS